jgi:hypothetical protein
LCSNPCSFNNLNFLNLESSGFYGYSSGTSTPFKRKISISYPEANKMEVTVKVYWQKKGAGEIEEFSITEHLYNWNQ